MFIEIKYDSDTSLSQTYAIAISYHFQEMNESVLHMSIHDIHILHTCIYIAHVYIYSTCAFNTCRYSTSGNEKYVDVLDGYVKDICVFHMWK